MMKERKIHRRSGKSFQFWQLHYLFARIIITNEKRKERKDGLKCIFQHQKKKKKKANTFVLSLWTALFFSRKEDDDLMCDEAASFAFFLFASRFYDCDFVDVFFPWCMCVHVLQLLLLTNSCLITQKRTRCYHIECRKKEQKKIVDIVAKTRVFFFLIGVINKVPEGISK